MEIFRERIPIFDDGVQSDLITQENFSGIYRERFLYKCHILMLLISRYKCFFYIILINYRKLYKTLF